MVSAPGKKAHSRLAQAISNAKTTCIAGIPLHRTEQEIPRNACKCIVNLRTLSLAGSRYLALIIVELSSRTMRKMENIVRVASLTQSTIQLPDAQA